METAGEVTSAAVCKKWHYQKNRTRKALETELGHYTYAACPTVVSIKVLALTEVELTTDLYAGSNVPENVESTI